MRASEVDHNEIWDKGSLENQNRNAVTRDTLGIPTSSTSLGALYASVGTDPATFPDNSFFLLYNKKAHQR